MKNPTISQKSEQTFTPTANAKKLFQAIYNEQKEKPNGDDETPKIHVSDIISKMAFYYEKIRNVVDYKEESLLRKNAIERIMRRQIVIEGALATKGVSGRDVAEHLLTELIRAAYLSNDHVPKAMIGEIGIVIDRYLLLKRYGIDRPNIGYQEKGDLTKWIIAIAASDIEERLGRSEVDMTIINYLYDELNQKIKLPDDSPYQADKEIQIFIGIHSNLLKYDQEMLSYILFKHFYPSWPNVDEPEIEEIGHDIVALKKRIDEQLNHPLSGQLKRIISRYTVFFMILKDVISENPVAIYETFIRDPKAFPRKIKQMAEKRYREAKSKLWRAGVRSILYIFVTKSIFAVILEVPASQLFGQEVNNISLAINVTFPAALLFLIILFARVPTDANTDKIVDGIKEVVFEEHRRQEPYVLSTPTPRRKMTQSVFGIIYAITFLVSLSIVVWMLTQIHFNFVSIIIFLFFLALVSFFSIRIRKGTRELVVIEPKESFFSFLVDFFYIPIVSFGKWLSENFSRINVFVFVLDFIIEAPFKVFVSIAEDWSKYVRERKDEIV